MSLTNFSLVSIGTRDVLAGSTIIKESESGFAQVKIIEDSKMNNLGNNFNNNNQFIQGKQRPLTHQTHHENIYNPQK